MSTDSPRRLSISLHDVAPATLDDCASTLALLDGLRLGPVALLVVPDYHGLGRDDTPLQYCATRDEVVVLQSGQTIAAPSLVVSARSTWRRKLSPLCIQALLQRHATSRVVRAAMHPADLRYPAIEQLWRRLFCNLTTVKSSPRRN